MEPEERTRAKKGGGKKSSEAVAIRAFVAAAYKGRLAKPGYVKACHSKAPEALVKVVPNPPHGSQVLRLLEYVARADADLKPKKSKDGIEPVDHQSVLILEDHEGHEHYGKEALSDLYKTWANDFEAVKHEGKTPRHVMHLVLSAKGENTPANQVRVMDAARITIKKQFPGYKYVIGLHQDGKRPHVHLVIACKGIEIDPEHKERTPKLRIGPAQIMQMRTSFARELTFQGLKHVATLRKDRPHLMERVEKGIEPLKPERRFWFTGAHNEMTKEFKEVEALHKEFQKHQAENVDRGSLREQLRIKLESLESLVRQQLREGSKNRAAAFGAMLKVKRDVGLVPMGKERKSAKKQRPSLAVQKATLEAQIVERLAKGQPVTREKEALKRVDTKIEAAEHDKKAKGVKPSDLKRLHESLDAARLALKTSNMPPEARAQAEQILRFHEVAMKQATGQQERPLTPLVAPQAPQVPQQAQVPHLSPATPLAPPQELPGPSLQTPKRIRR